jgi:hypothetical protein
MPPPEGETPESRKPKTTVPAAASKTPDEAPKSKLFRILNTSYQTLYITLPGRTLVLEGGRSTDVPESDITGNHHIKVMVRRGHIALFEH